MSNVFFKPWKGKNYGKGLFDKKILIVGESHYCRKGCNNCELKSQSSKCSNFTIDRITELIEGKTDSWTGTFRKFQQSVVGLDSNATEEEIWNSIAFYNYLQVAVGGSREAANSEDYQAAEAAFFEVLNELQPDLIIVWGVSRMYSRMPSKGWTRIATKTEGNYKIKHGEYLLENGHKIEALWVYHPSWAYSPAWWHKVIKQFI